MPIINAGLYGFGYTDTSESAQTRVKYDAVELVRGDIARLSKANPAAAVKAKTADEMKKLDTGFSPLSKMVYSGSIGVLTYAYLSQQADSYLTKYRAVSTALQKAIKDLTPPPAAGENPTPGAPVYDEPGTDAGDEPDKKTDPLVIVGAVIGIGAVIGLLWTLNSD